MTLIEINWRPASRQLRQFAVISLAIFPLLGWLWGASSAAVSLLAAIGLVIAIAGLLRPAIIRPIFLGLMIVTIPIGIVAGELALILIYVAVFIPIGILFKISRRDALKLKIDRQAKTYWQPKKQPRGPEQYYRQS